MRSFKCVIVGDGGVGKTSLVNKFLDCDFSNCYIPTIGTNVHPITFNTTYGLIALNVWDTAGKPEFGGLRDAYYIQSDCAIIMYDTRSSARNVVNWHKDLTRVCPDIPIVLVGNKKDLSICQYENPLKLPLVKISVKQNRDVEIPFLNLIRRLMDKEDLLFVN